MIAGRRSAARCAAAGIALAACAAPSGEEVRVAARSGDTLVVRTPDHRLVVTLTTEGGSPAAITAELAPAEAAPEAGAPLAEALAGRLAPGVLGWSYPAGELDTLRLTAQADGAPAWIATLAGASFRLWRPDDRAALARILDAAGLAAPLRAILPYHRRARAWLAESRAVFAVAALAEPATDPEPATWPALPPELDPPGRRADDRAGLGMICGADIRCPAEAPICVTASHADARGFCTRACVDAHDCDDAPGRCGLAVTDVPDVPRGLTACYLPCDDDGACPGHLACSAAFPGAHAICAAP